MDSVIAFVSCCGEAGVASNFSNSLVKSSNLNSALGYSGVGLLGEIVVVSVVAGLFANGVPTGVSPGLSLVGVTDLGETVGGATSAAAPNGVPGSPAVADAEVAAAGAWGAAARSMLSLLGWIASEAPLPLCRKVCKALAILLFVTKT